MPFKIVRNDIVKMNTEAIVNTTNREGYVGEGCDSIIYKEAGYDELLNYRRKNVGKLEEGDAFISPGFNLKADYIIHTVSPLYIDGNSDEENKLRNCYRNCLSLAKERHIKSVAFPLISTGSFGYPREEGMRIAVEEINKFLLTEDMSVYLVVFDTEATSLGRKISFELESYIDSHYVERRLSQEYLQISGQGAKNDGYRAECYNTVSFNGNFGRTGASVPAPAAAPMAAKESRDNAAKAEPRTGLFKGPLLRRKSKTAAEAEENTDALEEFDTASEDSDFEDLCKCEDEFTEQHETTLNERMQHLSDTFSQYLMYLIREKNMENADVWKRAIVDKKVFSKIKNNIDYHPQKLTALCLCVGARLNLDETRDLLARAGYALSPCDKTDIIFSYFIENQIYDMIEIDIQLEEHGLACIIA